MRLPLTICVFLFFAAVAVTGCDASHKGNIKTTFVLSDKMLNTIKIDTAKVVPAQVKLPIQDTTLPKRGIVHTAGVSLKPNVLKKAIIKDSLTVSVPYMAVIYDKGKHKQYVMVFKDKYNIEAREVQVNRSINGQSYISNGLKPGEKVVSYNQQLIYDALNE
ncbi:cobalt-zinc-cadmium efflux system membrane fusion protein [Chitinophaga skermanii]|uniref:Cobalt-zinc-cadmium efflux system membrane fusion protein n=1 Tax=Chitinophaga skermanii TaxID=331697 RepID=A0A327QSZ9_9BACT|nr:hypothetical protein [Chitinophaga skermanii]RAJ06975.1 cobalt-zinc-cadmium efflux system membrane fusion protein [Chitinophaga skermanii]